MYAIVGCDSNTCLVDFELMEEESTWDDHYKWADQRVVELKNEGKKMISLTHLTVGEFPLSVLWFEHHNPYKFL